MDNPLYDTDLDGVAPPIAPPPRPRVEGLSIYFVPLASILLIQVFLLVITDLQLFGTILVSEICIGLAGLTGWYSRRDVFAPRSGSSSKQ
jgi:hypothetical protein